MGWAEDDPCPLGCGHKWHGLPCEQTWTRNAFGTLVNSGRACGCPGPWTERTPA